jgi:glycosyltransferase involved in cell wall biosynthesis
MFGDPKIIIHDNNSTDDTAKIAVEHGADVVRFTTTGMNDMVQSQIKSDAAMKAEADWVLCIDADELCYVTSADLDDLDARGINAVQFEGWNIFDKVSSPWEVKVPMGVLTIGYAKPVLLKTATFENIQFAAGAHSIILGPAGKANFSISEYKLLHYKHWSCDWNLQRSGELAARQSDDNKAKGHSFHFALPTQTHLNFFNENYDRREPIVDWRIEYPEGAYVLKGENGMKPTLVIGAKDLPKNE